MRMQPDERHTGLKPKDIIGKTMLEIMPLDFAPDRSLWQGGADR